MSAAVHALKALLVCAEDEVRVGPAHFCLEVDVTQQTNNEPSPFRNVWTAHSPGFVAFPPSLCCRLLRRRKMRKTKAWMKV